MPLMTPHGGPRLMGKKYLTLRSPLARIIHAELEHTHFRITLPTPSDTLTCPRSSPSTRRARSSPRWPCS